MRRFSRWSVSGRNKVTQGCLCGNQGDPARICRCTPRQVEQYRRRVSGPLMDRIDLHVEVPEGIQVRHAAAAIQYRVMDGGDFEWSQVISWHSAKPVSGEAGAIQPAGRACRESGRSA